MNNELLEKLETALRERTPRLAAKLRPGRPEANIRHKLRRVGATGPVEPIVELFSWKDGTEVDTSLTQEQASLFPKSIFLFMDLDTMAGHFEEYRECLAHHPEYDRIANRYFPLFWDGANCWLAVDLQPDKNGRIVLIATEMEQMIFPAYASFHEFLNDAIRANVQNDRLACL